MHTLPPSLHQGYSIHQMDEGGSGKGLKCGKDGKDGKDIADPYVPCKPGSW